jgi:predicted transcriptional regulator of viral defense system
LSNVPGSVYDAIFELGVDSYGFVSQDQAREIGIPAQRLVVLEDRGLLERRRHGLYRVVALPVSPLDSYMEATLWPVGVQGVLSDETALELHGLSDVSPAKIHITVPRRHRTRRSVPAQYVIHRRDLDPRDVTSHEGIPIVTTARAIRDAHAGHLGPALIRQAIDDGERLGKLSQAIADKLREELLGE